MVVILAKQNACCWQEADDEDWYSHREMLLHRIAFTVSPVPVSCGFASMNSVLPFACIVHFLSFLYLSVLF